MKKLTLQRVAVDSMAPETTFWGPWVHRIITTHPFSGFRGRDDASSRREVGKGMGHTCGTNSDACYARLCRHFHGQRPLSASARTPRRVFFACLGDKKGPRYCARAADASCAAGNATSLRGAWHGVAKFAGGGLEFAALRGCLASSLLPKND